MENEKKVEESVVPTTTDTAKEPENSQNISQSPVQKELERLTKDSPSRKEKLLFTKNRIEKQLAEEFPETVVEGTSDEDKPLTMRDFVELQKKQTQQTAFQMADDIPDQYDRDLAKYHLENTVKPSGNPKKDLDNAMILVNAVKTVQVAEEISRKVKAKSHTSSPGAPVLQKVQEPELTAQEMSFMRPPYNLTREQIIAARSK